MVSTARGPIPSGGHILKEVSPVSAVTSTANSGGFPSSTRDQYRSPQTCPVLLLRRLNRTVNVCFNHYMIVGNCNPSVGLI
jgi:hypothetical protein